MHFSKKLMLCILGETKRPWHGPCKKVRRQRNPVENMNLIHIQLKRVVHDVRILRPAVVLALLLCRFGFAGDADEALPELTRPLSKVEALNLALIKNGTIREARKQVEAVTGIAIQTRAILFPTLKTGGTYSAQ